MGNFEDECHINRDNSDLGHLNLAAGYNFRLFWIQEKRQYKQTARKMPEICMNTLVGLQASLYLPLIPSGFHAHKISFREFYYYSARTQTGAANAGSTRQKNFGISLG
jgi:hypothetical protein